MKQNHDYDVYKLTRRRIIHNNHVFSSLFSKKNRNLLKKLHFFFPVHL